MAQALGKSLFSWRLTLVGLSAVTCSVLFGPPFALGTWSESTGYPSETALVDFPFLGQQGLATGQTVKAQYVILVSIDGLRPDAITLLGPEQLPNLCRFRSEGAWTDNARVDFNHSVTLPSHTTMLTARRVTIGAGHFWSANTDPNPNETIHSNRGSYVASIFDVVHDNGLRTGAYVSKSKFVLFNQTYDAANGASDKVGSDDGRDKIDDYRYDSDSDNLAASFIATMRANPFHFGFLHLRDPDSRGHSSGWMTPEYLSAQCMHVRGIGHSSTVAASLGVAIRFRS